MKNITRKATDETPYVNFNYNTGTIEMEGRSIPEDAEKFYEPLLSWINEYIQEPKDKLTINFKFEYFNTSSSKWLISMFKKFEFLHEEGHSVEINWYYEFDDLKEYIYEIQEIFEVPINLLKKA